MIHRIFILFLLLQSTLSFGQSNTDMLKVAMDNNDPSMLLDSMNLSGLETGEKELAFQYLKDFMDYRSEKKMTYQKLRDKKTIHFLEENEQMLFCTFYLSKTGAYSNLSFGPLGGNRFINLPTVKIGSGPTYGSLEVKETDFVEPHNLLADFDDAMKANTIEEKFTFLDPIAEKNFNEFKAIYNSKELIINDREPRKFFGSVNGSYKRDEFAEELSFIIWYDYVDSAYDVRVFVFTHTPKKKKVNKNDGLLIEEPRN